jgi:hypothetical protein
VNDKGLVAEEVGRARVGRQIRLVVGDGEDAWTSHVAVLSSQIAGLAGRWCANIAGEILATIGRIQMTQCRCAVAVSRDGKSVDVVD